MTGSMILTNLGTLYYFYIRYFHLNTLIECKKALYEFIFFMGIIYCLLGLNNERNNEKCIFKIKYN